MSYTLTITATNGSVDEELVSGELVSPGVYEAGSVVKLVAHADEGYTFGGFSVGLVSALNMQTITMSENKAVTATFAATTGNYRTMNAAWFASEGDSPWYLDDAEYTYTLHQNVSASGTGFVLIASDITLDLNGYTVTYDNATAITIPDGGFEAADLDTNWDISWAANADSAAGTYLSPVTLFEGSRALRFATPCANQYIVSDTQVTLLADTTYSLSMMDYSKMGSSVVRYVSLAGTGAGNGSTASDTGNSGRGFAFRSVVYKTGGTSEAYNVRAGISGATGASSGYAYLDDVKIGRYAQHGVCVGPKTDVPGYHADLTRWGYAYRSVIKNGRITQGADGGNWCAGIFYRGSAEPSEPYNLEITVHGPNCRAITTNASGASGDSDALHIHDNVLTSTVLKIDSRDALHGILEIKSAGASVHDNVITGTPHCGMELNDNGTAMTVYNNVISITSSNTNGCAIFLASDHGSDVYDNTINGGSPGDSYSAHGIQVYGAVGGTKIHGNTIAVRARQLIQEYCDYGGYTGYEYDGMFGIQMRDGVSPSYTLHDIDIYGNNITAYAEGYESHCIRIRAQYATELKIHENALTAQLVSGSMTPSLFRIAADPPPDGNVISLTADHVDIYDNELLTNGRVVTGYHIKDLTLRLNHFDLMADLPSPYYPLVCLGTTGKYIANLIFLDMDYADTAAHDAITNATIVHTNGVACDGSSFTDMISTVGFMLMA